jgi:hypothetical protein
VRRPLAALSAVTLVLALSGCTLVSSWISTLRPDSTPLPLDETSCLTGMNAADSDRNTVVVCTEPHLFEVTGLSTWPGMSDMVDDADGDLGAVWDALHLVNGTEENADYGMWASRTCNEAAQRRVGIDDVEVEGHTAADLWLRVGGTYNVDLSLGSREQFLAGDASTVCSLAWYDDSGRPRLLTGPEFSRLLHPGFPADRRECWSGDYSGIACDEPHAAQVLLAFDGLEAFGPEVIERAATGQPTEDDWATEDAFCEALLVQTLPSTANLGDVGYLADIQPGYGWDGFDGTVDPDAPYFYACVAAGLAADDMLTGDVFEGTAEIDAPGSTA